MFLRAKNRDGAKYIGISFCYEGACWKIALRKAQFWRILYASAKVRQGDLLSFCPQISYNITKNGKQLMAAPNFWTNSAGIALCKATEADGLVMHIEIVFKDLPMARAFVAKLLEDGCADKINAQHNKIVFDVKL